MYLGTIYVSTKFRPDRTSNMAILGKPTELFTCTYVPLGKSNSQTQFQSSLILGHQ
jgi:hypothetical protein